MIEIEKWAEQKGAGGTSAGQNTIQSGVDAWAGHWARRYRMGARRKLGRRYVEVAPLTRQAYGTTLANSLRRISLVVLLYAGRRAVDHYFNIEYCTNEVFKLVWSGVT